MAKYYVASGSLSVVVQARDAEGAALWALHQHLQHHTATAGDERAQQPISELFTDACIDDVFATLADFVDVSEIGLGRTDAGHFQTARLVQKYVQLLTAIDRIVDASPSRARAR